MQAAIRIVAAAASLASAAAIAQDVPASKAPVQGDEVIVTGRVTHIEAGLWAFRRWPSRKVSVRLLPPAGRRFDTAPGQAWRSCIADAALPDAVRQLLGAGTAEPPQPGCSRMNVQVRAARITGRRSCSSYGVDRNLRYEGRLTPASVDVSVLERGESDGGHTETMSRLTGRRIGRCGPAGSDQARLPTPATPETPNAPVVAATPKPAPTPSRQPVLLRSQDDHDTNVDGHTNGRPPPPPVAGQPDDVVVVARKLRLMRLHYGSDGRFLRFCHADVSSGDPRLDRIGCATVRACVREGHSDKASATACFDRKVDQIDAPG